MRVLKSIVYLCFVILTLSILLINFHAGEKAKEVDLLVAGCPISTGCRTLDGAISTVYFAVKYSFDSTKLLTFLYFVVAAAASYAGFISGLIFVVTDRGRKNFLFTLSFITCAFFATANTAIIIFI